MILETLELKDFRNYEKEEVVFNEKVNILTGKNAQGKTNLIEAINLLSLGKSFRTRKEQELIRFGEEEARVKGVFIKKDRLLQTEVRINTGAGQKTNKKTYLVNDLESNTVASLLGGVYTIVFSPEDLRIVKGEPEGRRRFLDRELILLKPLYYSKLRDYKNILKARNAFLKSEPANLMLLDVYDEQLAEAAAAVMTERAAYLERLSEAAKDAGDRITNGEEQIEISYKPHISQVGDEYTKEAILKVIEKNREKDVLSRTTETGPHRDDFAIFASGLDLRAYGSQGQQRTAALAIRLAERELIRQETGENAILLLDDVMSELDAGRQDRLLGSFGENQIFITAAARFEAEAAKLRAAKIMKIEKGKIV